MPGQRSSSNNKTPAENISRLTDQFRLALIENTATEEALSARIQANRARCISKPSFQILGDSENFVSNLDLVCNMNQYNTNSSLRYGGVEESINIYEPKDSSTTQASARWKYYPYYQPAKNPSFALLHRQQQQQQHKQ